MQKNFISLNNKILNYLADQDVYMDYLNKTKPLEIKSKVTNEQSYDQKNQSNEQSILEFSAMGSTIQEKPSAD